MTLPPDLIMMSWGRGLTAQTFRCVLSPLKERQGELKSSPPWQKQLHQLQVYSSLDQTDPGPAMHT